MSSDIVVHITYSPANPLWPIVETNAQNGTLPQTLAAFLVEDSNTDNKASNPSGEPKTQRKKEYTVTISHCRETGTFLLASDAESSELTTLIVETTLKMLGRIVIRNAADEELQTLS